MTAVIEDLLYGVTAHDPLTFCSVGGKRSNVTKKSYDGIAAADAGSPGQFGLHNRVVETPDLEQLGSPRERVG